MAISRTFNPRRSKQAIQHIRLFQIAQFIIKFCTVTGQKVQLGVMPPVATKVPLFKVPRGELE